MSGPPTSLSEARAKCFARHCCERGCDHCVFTVYYEAIDAWRRDVERAWH